MDSTLLFAKVWRGSLWNRRAASVSEARPMPVRRHRRHWVKEVMVAMLTPTSCCALTVLPVSGVGAPVERALAYPELNLAIATALAVSMLAAALGVLWLTERQRIQSFVRRRLQAVRNSEATPRVVTPLRRGVGGISGRVPPRSAAGSTLPLRLAPSPRRRQ